MVFPSAYLRYEVVRLTIMYPLSTDEIANIWIKAQFSGTDSTASKDSTENWAQDVVFSDNW